MLKSSAGYLKGEQGLDHCQYGCSYAANICSLITTDTLDSESHFPKMLSLNLYTYEHLLRNILMDNIWAGWGKKKVSF